MSLRGKERSQILSFQEMGFEPVCGCESSSDARTREDVGHLGGRHLIRYNTDHSVRCHLNSLERVLEPSRGGGIPFKEGSREHTTKDVALHVGLERFTAF